MWCIMILCKNKGVKEKGGLICNEDQITSICTVIILIICTTEKDGKDVTGVTSYK